LIEYQFNQFMEREMNIIRMGIISALCVTSILAGCGGGGSSTSATTPTGVVNVTLTDGPGDDYDHVWITVKAISFHTDSNITWNKSDATWKTTTLATPVTLDMANLTNGALSQVFTGMNLPVGSYKQIRLFLAGFDDALTTSASAAGLTYNDQIDYTDNSVVHHVPLEIAYPVQGIQLNGNFNVTEGSTLNLAVDFDLEHDLVRFKHGTEFHFTMKPNLHYFDLNQSGAITGNIDPAQLCVTTASSSCAYNLIVKAEILSADGTRHFDTRATTIKPDGSFTLYPLPSGASYDVLIRGRNIETMLVKGVVAPAGSTPASGAAVLSTAATPIPLTINTSEYFANFSAPLSPTSGYAIFQQTLPGATEVPYEVRWRNTNPFTGILEGAVAVAYGPMHVASYSSGRALAFSSVIPQEGNGGYSVVTRGLPLAYYDLSSPVVLAVQPTTATAAAPYLFTPPLPTLTSNVVAGTVSGNITQTTHGMYDSGYLVLSRFANIVHTVDISATLAANTGTYSVTLPAGTSGAPVPGAYYYGYLRVWNSAAPKLSTRVFPINGMIDLRNTNAVTGMNVTLP
jgi:hypothetical protein